MINAPITNTAVSGMPLAQACVAAGVASTSRQVGSALGVAVLGSLVTSQPGVSFGDFARCRPASVGRITAIGESSRNPLEPARGQAHSG